MVLIISILRYLISLSNILCNSFLIFALRRRKKLKIISYWLIFCLSCSDVFFGIFALINESFTLALVKNCWEDDTCFATNACEFFFGNFSATFLLIIAIDRFVHLKYSLRYQSIMKRRTANALICFNVIFTFHIVVTIVLLPKYQTQFLLRHLRSYRIYRAVLSFVYVSVMLSVCVLYIVTYCSIKKRVFNINAIPAIEIGKTAASRDGNDDAKGSDVNRHRRRRRRRRRPNQDFAVCIMFIIILVIFFEVPNLCLTVYERVSLLFQPQFTYSREMFLASEWTLLLFQLNSSLNAVVLLVFSGELRKFTRNLFKWSSNTEKD